MSMGCRIRTGQMENTDNNKTGFSILCAGPVFLLYRKMPVHARVCEDT